VRRTLLRATQGGGIEVVLVGHRGFLPVEACLDLFDNIYWGNRLRGREIFCFDRVKRNGRREPQMVARNMEN
jgi:hypothetical protein